MIFATSLLLSLSSYAGWFKDPNACDASFKAPTLIRSGSLTLRPDGKTITVYKSGLTFFGFGRKPKEQWTIELAGNFIEDLGHVNTPEMPLTATRPEGVLLRTDQSFEVLALGPGAKWKAYPSIRFSDLARYGYGSEPAFAELVESSYSTGEVETTSAAGYLDLVRRGYQKIMPARVDGEFQYLHDDSEDRPERTQLVVVFKNGQIIAGDPQTGVFRRLGEVPGPAPTSVLPDHLTVDIWQHSKALMFWQDRSIKLLLFRGERSGEMTATLPQDDAGPIEKIRGESFNLTGGGAAMHGAFYFVGTGRIIVTTAHWIHLYRVKDGRLVFEERTENTKLSRYFTDF